MGWENTDRRQDSNDSPDHGFGNIFNPYQRKNRVVIQLTMGGISGVADSKKELYWCHIDIGLFDL